MTGNAAVTATFEIDPPDAGPALALQLSTAMDGGPAWAEGRVVDSAEGTVTVELPAALYGNDLVTLVTGVGAGEAMEVGAFDRCRLVDLEVPEGMLPGPAIGTFGRTDIGVIVKPSVGLSPAEVSDVVAAAVAGGARWVKDDEVLTDPPWCPLAERVGRVARRLEPGVVYFANVTGSSAGLVERARRAVDLGATGVMVAALPQGIGSVEQLRRAELGVPILAHRAGSGPWCRNERFGMTGAVLIGLLRLAGADAVVAGAFGGKLFETDAEVSANLHAARGPLPPVRAATALLGGGLGPGDVSEQKRRAGGTGLVLLLGSAAYTGGAGLEQAVGAAVEALR